MPSTVLIARPCSSTGSARHDSTGSPSTSTVQVPHSPSSQPCLVPVRPRSSRSTSSSVLCGAKATSTASPLTRRSRCAFRIVWNFRRRMVKVKARGRGLRGALPVFNLRPMYSNGYGGGYGYDFTYLLYVVPGMLLALLAQWYVKATVRRWLEVPTSGRRTGAQIARQLLAAAGVHDVVVERHA